MRKIDKDFLLKSYGEPYNSECGPWNTSLTSKWLEYEITRFFEENFLLLNKSIICNIGIGAGYWDRYLSYKMPSNCTLVSIDVDYECCKQLKLSLINEKNPNAIQIINEDVLKYDTENKFNIITMIGSTVIESKKHKEILNKVLSLLSIGGSLFYNSTNIKEEKECLFSLIDQNLFSIEKYVVLENYGKKIILAKITLK